MSQDYDETTIKIVNQLFKDLFSIKPAYQTAFKTSDDLKNCKRQWIIAFKDADINSIEKLKFGLKKARMDPNPFFPSPGEFIAMCKPRPEDLNAPSLDNAYKEACMKSHPCYGLNKHWSHPAVNHAWKATGAYTLRENKEAVGKPKFKENYEHALNLAANNELKDEIESKKTLKEYQEFVGRMKSDIILGLKEEQKIPSFEEWSKYW